MGKKYITDIVSIGDHSLDAAGMVQIDALIEDGLHSEAGYLTEESSTTKLTDAEIAGMGYIKTYTDTDTNTQLTSAQISAMGYASSGFDSVANLSAPNTTVGTWNTSTTVDWGTPRIGSSVGRYIDNAGSLSFAVPAGMKTAYISQLTWSTGGYADVYGIQADGDAIFLRRINTKQSLENSNHGNPNQHDGSTIAFAGHIGDYPTIRISNKSGRLHLTGLGFSKSEVSASDGTGMVNPSQFSTPVTYSSISGTPSIPSGNSIIDWTADQGSTNIHSGNYTDTNTQLTTAQIGAMGYIKENEDRRHKVLRFTGEGSNSNNGVINYGIYQEGGGWGNPFPDLVIGYHTGVKIGGYTAYNGTRFYSDAPGRSGAVELMSVGDGDSNVRVTNVAYAGDSFRAPGFFDTNDTNYYGDFASPGTAVMANGKGRFRQSQSDNNYTTAALWTESYNSTGTGIAFHISGNVGKYLEMRTNGVLYWENQKVWTGGTDGAGSGLDADLLHGLGLNGTTNNAADKIVRTQANGYIHAGWINSVSGNHSGNITRITASNDGYLRYVTPAQFRTQIIDGNYAPISHTHNYQAAGTYNTVIGTDSDVNTSGPTIIDNIYMTDGVITSHGTRNLAATDIGAMRVQGRTVSDANHANFRVPGSYGFSGSPTNGTGEAYGAMLVAANSDTGLQIAGGYSNDDLYFRGWASSGATYYAWRKVLHSNNYNNYAPTKTGGGASGSWSIDINGSANLLDGINSTSFLRSDATDYQNNTIYQRGYLVNETGYRNRGVYGSYNSSKTNHIWSMGTNYKNHASGTNFGNLYGLSYKHTNNSTGGTMGGGHQMVWCNNGSARGAIGYDSVWHTSSVRAPIFYDTTDTGYYLNPASTSVVQRITHKNHTTPILIKVNSGYKSWVHHIASGGGSYIFAPSTANGGESWDWANQMSISTSGVVTANNFVLRSDERSKTKIKNLTRDNIDVSWKSFEMKGNEDDYRTGVIAQELEETHPEFVNTDPKGFKSVKYIDLLIAKIAELEARLEKLEK